MRARIPGLYLLTAACCLGAAVCLLPGCGDEDPVRPASAPGTVLVSIAPDGLAADWSLRLDADVLAAGCGDSVLTGLPIGRYALEFPPLVDWISPAVQLGMLAAGDTLRLTGQFSPVITPTGGLRILPYPQGLPAGWLLEGPGAAPHRGSGDSTLVDLAAGAWTLTWEAVPGFTSPALNPAAVLVAAGQTRVVTGAYEQIAEATGKILVDPHPSESVANWLLEGPAGYTHQGRGVLGLTGMAVGTYRVTWLPTEGWLLPEPDTLERFVVAGTTTQFAATYRQEPLPSGTIRIVPQPPELDATWILMGPSGTFEGQGADLLLDMLVGNYRIVWNAVSGWGLPDPPEAIVALLEDEELLLDSSYQALPPAPVVPVSATAGSEVGSVILHWGPAAANSYPLASYEAVFSTDGPVDAANFDQATLLGVYTHVEGLTTYGGTFDATHGLVEGADTWFAVRARDATGLASDVTESPTVVVSFSWWIEGRVTDSTGAPLAGVLMDANCVDCDVTTDATGWYRAGPFASSELVSLTAFSSSAFPGMYYDYQSAPRYWEYPEGLDVVLIPRYPVEPDCDDFQYEFLNYFRFMTNTNRVSSLRPNQNLYRWESYPVPVWVPDYTNSFDIDMAARVRSALALWNTTLGEDYFVEVADSAAAQVVLRFDNDVPNAFGQVLLLKPDDLGYRMGDVIPELVEIYINIDMTDAQHTEEVALHEMGHVLGLINHTFCSGCQFLMYVSSSGILDNGPENAIHPDEQNAIRLIRSLPQGQDMGGYLQY